MAARDLGIADRQSSRPWLLADLLAKTIALAAPLVAIVVLQAAGAGSRTMTVRLSLYMASVIVIPLIWWASGRPRPYPFAADIALVVPFVLDAVRIALEVSWVPGLDAVPHVGGWACISVVVGLAVAPIVRERWIGLWLMVGSGAIIAIVWEIGEYALSRGVRGVVLSESDTVTDLALSLVGAVVGAVAVVVGGWPRPSTPRTPFGWSR